MRKQKYIIPGSGQIEFFTDTDETLIRFKQGEVCYIRNKDIEVFKKEIYTVIEQYRIKEKKTTDRKAL